MGALIADLLREFIERAHFTLDLLACKVHKTHSHLHICIHIQMYLDMCYRFVGEINLNRDLNTR